jgi:hypothetical protein
VEVFALSLKIKEEGAATVQAATAKLNTELRKTQGAAAGAADKLQRAQLNAAKGSLAFGGMARSMAQTGNAASLMSGGIVEAGTHIATFMGPGGVLLMAVGGLAVAVRNAFTKMREDVVKEQQKIIADTRALFAQMSSLAASSSRERLTEALVELSRGQLFVVAEQQLRVLDETQQKSALAERGLVRLSDEYARLQQELADAGQALRQFGMIPASERTDAQRAAITRANESLRTGTPLVRLYAVEISNLQRQASIATQRLNELPVAVTAATQTATQTAAEAVSARAAQLVELAKLQILSATQTDALRAQEVSLNAALASGNLTVEQRIERLKELQAVTDALVASEAKRTSGERLRAELDRDIANRGATRIGSTVTGPMNAPGAGLRLPSPKPLFDAAADAAKQIEDQLRETFANAVGNSIGDGIAAGFERGFATGKIGEGFKALAGTMLAGLGSAMIQFGQASLVASQFMQRIKDSLAAMSPKGAIIASLAMIAAGGALRGVASRAFGGMGGGGGIPVTPTTQFGIPMGQNAPTQLIFGATSATTAAGMTPRQAINVTIIGPNDPTAQRAMQELMRNANQRGTLG